ncbi:hypothetical protein [Ectopseudomonas mendocina]|uniref:Uncharacterized protein n=1 Tax=Ectopseudomonas mendocina TaxID=300 RepID=A0A2R3QHK2_ECTME|nr:hypothetical protein [Pseudomonas mendocina]AVO51238.1 hypothetical protein C7A17_00115 [Pseudomonas mendocina]
MNKPTAITDAIGVVKLVSLHHANPSAVSAATVRDAAEECIERLQAIPPLALELAALYCALLAILPARWLPYVTCTVDTERPFGAVITDEAGNIAATGTGKTVEGLATLIATKLGHNPAGCGEVVR